MSFDWITVAAQIANFLVLVWLLKRFLYRPILDGIDAREAEIAARMGEAARIRTAADAEKARYKGEIAALGASRAEMLDAARRDATQERDALLSQAHKRLQDEQAERDTIRADEARKFAAQLHKTGAEALLALTRKALLDLADETLEQRIVAHAAARLANVSDELRAAGADSREAVALTRHALPEAERAALRNELAAILPGCSLRFETDASLSPGLSLRLGGAQVAWTVDGYLDGLDAVLDDLADRPAKGAVHAA